MSRWNKLRIIIRFLFIKTKNCPICFECLSTDLFTTKCGHVFHKSCMDKWNKDTCPYCRQLSGRKKNIMSDFGSFRYYFDFNMRSDIIGAQENYRNAMNRLAGTTDNTIYNYNTFRFLSGSRMDGIRYND